MMTKRQLQRMMIQRRGKQWDTLPERQFKDFNRKHGLGFAQNQSISVSDEGEYYTYQLDFARPLNWRQYLITGFFEPKEGYDVNVEIDGPDHDSERAHRKDLWKDFIKAKHGLKVIHVPAVLCNPKWWDYLKGQMDKAIAGQSRSVWIAA